MLFVFHPKILYKHCFQFLLGFKIAPRETEDNAYAKFCGDKQKVFLYSYTPYSQMADAREKTGA